MANDNGRLGDFVAVGRRDVEKEEVGGLHPVWRRSQEAVLVICCLYRERDGERWKRLGYAGEMREWH